VVTTDLRSTSTTGPTQQLLDGCHASVYPGSAGVPHCDGGCKDIGAAGSVRAVKVIPPGASKRAQSTPNSSLA